MSRSISHHGRYSAGFLCGLVALFPALGHAQPPDETVGDKRSTVKSNFFGLDTFGLLTSIARSGRFGIVVREDTAAALALLKITSSPEGFSQLSRNNNKGKIELQQMTPLEALQNFCDVAGLNYSNLGGAIVLHQGPRWKAHSGAIVLESLDMKDATLEQTFGAIAKATDVTIIVRPQVAGIMLPRVSLKHVSLEDVLGKLNKVANVAWWQSGVDEYTIVPAEAPAVVAGIKPTVEVKSMPLREVFSPVARSSDIAVTVDDDITETLPFAYFGDTPPVQTLKQLAMATGLACIQTGPNSYRIKKQDLVRLP